MCAARYLVVALVAGCSFRGATVSGDPDAATSEDGTGVVIDAPPTEIDARALVVPMVIQEKTNFASNGTTLTASLAQPHAGNMLVMIGAANHASLAGVSGGGVTTWRLAAKSNANANVELWFGVTDATSNTVTISLPGNTGPLWQHVAEWSGLDAANPLDAAVATNGITSPAGAGTIAIGARELVLFAVADLMASTLGTPTAGPWSSLTGIANASVTQSEWFQIRSTGLAPTATETSHLWDAVLAGFRIAP